MADIISYSWVFRQLFVKLIFSVVLDQRSSVAKFLQIFTVHENRFNEQNTIYLLFGPVAVRHFAFSIFARIQVAGGLSPEAHL